MVYIIFLKEDITRLDEKNIELEAEVAQYKNEYEELKNNYNTRYIKGALTNLNYIQLANKYLIMLQDNIQKEGILDKLNENFKKLEENYTELETKFDKFLY